MIRVDRGKRCLNPGRRRGRIRLVLETLEERELLAVFTVSNTNDNTSAGSLRWAIQQANLDQNPASVIDFAILGTGVQTISLQSALPALTHPTTIDGSTQSGYSGSPLVELDCSAVPQSDTALSITAGNSTLRALVVDNCPGTAIGLSSNGSDVIAGCYVGTTPDGSQAKSNGLGILISDSSNNTIGGTGPHDPNLISGNTSDGIRIVSSSNSLIIGNDIGTDITGKNALRNGNNGIAVTSSSGTTIGGTTNGSSNLISGNGGDGIDLTGGPAGGTVVEGNFIGTDASGTTDLGNSGTGIVLGSSQVTIGGTNASAGNIIAYNKGSVVNSGDGIRFVSNSDQCAILSNSIFGNAGLGIDFGSGPTTNHPWPPGVTAGSGPNDYQNYPILNSAVSSGKVTTIQGTLNAAPNSTFVVQFFSNSTEDPSGHGEGQTYLGSTTVTTDSTSNASFAAVLSGVSVPAGWFVTATATDASGNTSEFSQDVQSKAELTAELGISGGASANQVYVGAPLTYSFTINNNGPQSGENVEFVDTLPAGVSYQGSFTSTLSGISPIVSGQQISANLGSLAQGSSVILSFAVQFQPSAGSSVINTATVSTSDFDPNSSDNSTSVTVNALLSADLDITSITTSPAAPNYVGSNLTYQINAGNNGPSDATSVTVTDPLPPNTTFVSATGGVTPDGSGDLVFSVGNLTAGATAKLTFTVQPTAAAGGGTISDSATISGNEHDPDTGNNTYLTQPLPISPLGAELQVEISPDVTSVLAGANVIYTIKATNNGPLAATGVQVTDTLSPASELTFVSATGGITPDSSGKLTFPALSLAVGSSITYTVEVQPTAAAAVNSPLVNTATIRGDQLDAITSNNTSQIAINVSPAVNLEFAHFTAAPNPTQIGSPFSYSIGVINSGPSPATNVTLKSSLGPGVSLVGVSASPSSVVGSNVVVNLGTLLPAATATVTITVIPSLIGNLPATATISSAETDLNPPAETATTSSVVLGKVGTIEFSATGYTVPEDAGQAVITVNRVGGARGTVTVDYTTVAINAAPGVDFRPVSGTWVFASGVTSQTITLPVLADPYDNRNELVSVALSNAQTTETVGTALLGSPSTTTVTIQDLDPNDSPLAVAALQWAGTAQSIRQIALTFNKPLSSSSATNPANYSLVNVGPDGKYGTRDDSAASLGLPTYNLTNRTVILTPARPLPANRFFHLQIKGTAGGGVEDLWANLLAGNGTTAGTDYTIMLAQGTNLRYATPLGDQVSLRITGGGMIEDLLSGTGQGEQLTVVGAVPHHTVVSGSVRKSRAGTGQAYIGPTIYGLGQFGDVRVRMYSPPFLIGQYPFSPGSTASSTSKALAQADAVTKGSPSSTAKTSAVRRATTSLLRPMVKFHR
jgi:uncharacterized repeat protein (TIGR01451 family)